MKTVSANSTNGKFSSEMQSPLIMKF